MEGEALVMPPVLVRSSHAMAGVPGSRLAARFHIRAKACWRIGN